MTALDPCKRTYPWLVLLIFHLGLGAPWGCGDGEPRGDDDSGDDDTAGDDDSTSDDDDSQADDDDTPPQDDDDDSSPGVCDDLLTLDTHVAESCTSWVEQFVELEMTAGTCGGECVGSTASTGVTLAPARLQGRVASLGCVVRQVEIELIDSAGPGTVEASLLGSSGALLLSKSNTQSGATETIVLRTSEIPGSKEESPYFFSVSGCDTRVLSVQVY